MIAAALPHNEEQRLHDLHTYDILDSQAESDFDNLVELASTICQCPVSLISLLDKDRQWFKANKGLDQTSTPRDVAFCAHAILQDGVMTVPDATADERFYDNPLVTGGPRIRFYAGAPIVSPTGHKVGTICLIDTQPKTLTPAQEQALKLLSNQAAKLLELRRRNIQLRERSEEIIRLKCQSIRKIMDEGERQKKEASYQLHEQIAQSLAASIFFLKMAETDVSQSQPLVSKTKQQLQQTLQDVRNLSYQFTPPGVDMLDVEELLTEYVHKAAPAYPFTLSLAARDNAIAVAGENVLPVLRIVDAWLRILGQFTNAREVHLSLLADQQLILQIEDNADDATADREKLLYSEALFDKVQRYQGQLSLKKLSSNRHLFQVTLPADKSKKTDSTQLSKVA